MKLQPTFSLRMGACAAALMGASLMVQAQTQPAPSMPDPSAMPAEIHKQHPKRMPHQDGNHKAGKKSYATPQQHEAAAVANERRRGTGPANTSGAQPNQFERNALQRCEIFKTDDDRRACVERVRQPQISGSVEGGGVIREYTQTIQVPAAPSPQYNAPPPPAMQQTPHMMHHPVEPMRR